MRFGGPRARRRHGASDATYRRPVLPPTEAPSVDRRRPPHARRGVAVLVAAALLLPLPASVGAADDLDDRRRSAQEQAEGARQRTDDLRASVEGLSADLAQAVAELAETETRLPVAQEQLRAAQATLDGAERRAEILAARLVDARDQQATLRDGFARTSARDDEVRAAIGQLARQAQRGGAGASGLAVVLDAEDLDEFSARMQALETAQRSQDRLLEELTALAAATRNHEARLAAVADRIGELRAEADAEVVRADQARADAAAREAEITRLLAEQEATRQRLGDMKAQAEAEAAAADRERAAIEAELAGIIAEQQRVAAEQERARVEQERIRAEQERARAEEAAKAGQQPPPPAPPPAQPAPPPASGSSGPVFSNPTSITPMYVTSSYGMRLHPILGYTRLHAGIDLRTYCNTPLYAPRDAVVRWAQWRNGFGNQVMLDHGSVDGQSLMSSLNHLTRDTVSAGQRVQRGDLVGYAGNTGLSGACHLHFEVYRNGSTVNPAPLLGR